MKCFYCQNDTAEFATNANICNTCPSTPIYFFDISTDITFIDYSFEYGEDEYVITYSLNNRRIGIHKDFKIITIFENRDLPSLQDVQYLMDKFLKLKAFI